MVRCEHITAARQYHRSRIPSGKWHGNAAGRLPYEKHVASNRSSTDFSCDGDSFVVSSAFETQGYSLFLLHPPLPLPLPLPLLEFLLRHPPPIFLAVQPFPPLDVTGATEGSTTELEKYAAAVDAAVLAPDVPLRAAAEFLDAVVSA